MLSKWFTQYQIGLILRLSYNNFILSNPNLFRLTLQKTNASKEVDTNCFFNRCSVLPMCIACTLSLKNVYCLSTRKFGATLGLIFELYFNCINVIYSKLVDLTLFLHGVKITLVW